MYSAIDRHYHYKCKIRAARLVKLQITLIYKLLFLAFFFFDIVPSS